MKQLSGAPLYGRLLALPTNIGPGKNTLAYYENEKSQRKKGFITLTPDCPDG
jgi:hypothetical protein